MAVTGLFVVGLLLGSWTGRAAVARAVDPYTGLDRFARVLAAIEADYVEPVDGDELLDAALDGMVGRLDPHSRWMSASAVAELDADAEGSATGFGVEVGQVDDGVVVIRVLPGSPAEREGLTRGDRILGIDGTPLAGMDLDGVRALFDGDRGQRADLEVLRDGWQSPKTLSARREQVHVPAIESALLAGDVMYVRVVDFQRGGAAELDRDVRAMQERATVKWAGLILDLRDNTGGLLDEAVAVTDLFIDEGPVVSVRGRPDGAGVSPDSPDGRGESVRSPDGVGESPPLGSGEITVHRATAGGFPPELPVVVLVNGMSASASEIVAGALRETGRAQLVGSATYGKGSVQQLYRNPDGSALKLTVAEYLLPSGATIPARQGLVPDHVAGPTSPEGPRAMLHDRLQALPIGAPERDELLALLDGLEERDPPMPRVPWQVPVDQRSEQDPALRKALDLVRGSNTR